MDVDRPIDNDHLDPFSKLPRSVIFVCGKSRAGMDGRRAGKDKPPKGPL